MARRRRINTVLAAAGAGLLTAAVVTELRKPAGERGWHGRVAGFVPYDFRYPSPDRLRAALWDPDGRLFVPHVFGVGWSLNLGRLLRRRGAVEPAEGRRRRRG